MFRWREVRVTRVPHFFSSEFSFGLGFGVWRKVNFSAGRDSFHVPFLKSDLDLLDEQPVISDGRRRIRNKCFIGGGPYFSFGCANSPCWLDQTCPVTVSMAKANEFPAPLT